MSDCVFCNIVSGVFTSSKVYEDDSVLAFMDIFPVIKGHVLIIPKKHSEMISDVENSTLEKMFVLAAKINTSLRKSGIKCEGVNFFLADGAVAGQEIFHTHLHVFPRFKNDGFGLKFPAGYKTEAERSELDSIAGKIKSAL